MKKLLVAGNSTMPSSVGIFNLPPLLTCKPSRWCREHCYALKKRFLWKRTKEAHRRRYKQSLKPSFVERMIDEIKHRPSINYIRPHITGDFYSKEYIDKWAQIAKAFPSILFRATTRRIDFLRHMKKVFPKNVVIRESTDPTRKGSGIFPQASIRGTEGTEGFFVCMDDCAKCNFWCYHHPKANVVSGRIR